MENAEVQLGCARVNVVRAPSFLQEDLLVKVAGSCAARVLCVSGWTGFSCKHLTGDMGGRDTCGCAGLSLLAWLLPHHSEVIITSTQPIRVENFKSNQIVPPFQLFITAKLPNQLSPSKLVSIASSSLMTLLLQRGRMKKSGERAGELKPLLYLCRSRRVFRTWDLQTFSGH